MKTQFEAVMQNRFYEEKLMKLENNDYANKIAKIQ